MRIDPWAGVLLDRASVAAGEMRWMLTSLQKPVVILSAMCYLVGWYGLFCTTVPVLYSAVQSVQYSYSHEMDADMLSPTYNSRVCSRLHTLCRTHPCVAHNPIFYPHYSSVSTVFSIYTLSCTDSTVLIVILIVIHNTSKALCYTDCAAVCVAVVPCLQMRLYDEVVCVLPF